ncbi:MAG TPA: type II toxin-antitoxin system RatA family toxin [Casimicrobiaceae bacterium]|jgi:ribosome-associated toxin RatA of RatAB toxin-antitoxin module
MRSVHKSVLVPYSARQMFELVDRIEDYPKFLPWCGSATILEHTADGALARIDIDYHGVRAHFTTANRNHAPDRIVVELRDGPFRRLDGIWQFRALSDTACKVEFELDYEFATPLLETLIGPVFGRIADSFIDAFVRRAASLYGGGA